MPIRPDELERHLARQLAPVYLIGGEEPLFVRESEDAVRAAARAAGCNERVVLEVEAGFDWNRLSDAAANLSLFGDRRLIELRLPTGKPGTAGAKAVEDPSTWSQEFDEDTEFVDAADLLDEEPTINSKGGIGKENII